MRLIAVFWKVESFILGVKLVTTQNWHDYSQMTPAPSSPLHLMPLSFCWHLMSSVSLPAQATLLNENSSGTCPNFERVVKLRACWKPNCLQTTWPWKKIGNEQDVKGLNLARHWAFFFFFLFQLSVISRLSYIRSPKEVHLYCDANPGLNRHLAARLLTEQD